MTDERRAHLEELAGTLWPAPHRAVLGGGGTPGDVVVEELLVLPGRRRPRLLAPPGRRAAAAVVRHHGEGRNARGRLAAGVLALGLRAGLGALLRHGRLVVTAPPGSDPVTLSGHLAAVLGQAVVMGTHLGPPRANRKPVIQLLSPQGRTLAYAKVAVDDLTDRLVGTETAALIRLAGAGTRIVQVADVVHAGRWRGRGVLVQSALPVWSRRRPLTRARHVAAVAEVAAIDRQDDVAVTASEHWADLLARLDRLPDGEATTQLRGVVRRLGEVARATDVRLSTGASHGDWTPWNMACTGDRLLVWDWERFRLGVPVGADLLHHGLQSDVVARRTDPVAAAARMVRTAPEQLAPLGVAPRAALVTAVLYGADLAARYLADRQLEAGARLGDVGRWLSPALLGGIRDLEGEQ